MALDSGGDGALRELGRWVISPFSTRLTSNERSRASARLLRSGSTPKIPPRLIHKCSVEGTTSVGRGDMAVWEPREWQPAVAPGDRRRHRLSE